MPLGGWFFVLLLPSLAPLVPRELEGEMRRARRSLVWVDAAWGLVFVLVLPIGAPRVLSEREGEMRRARRSLVWVDAAWGDVDLFLQDSSLELARLSPRE
jgi:hypothetical protein